MPFDAQVLVSAFKAKG